MRKIIFSLSVFLIVVTGCSTTNTTTNDIKGNKPYVILMGGQSNMVGQGKTEELKNYQIPRNFQFFNIGKANFPKRFGPEVGVWNKLSNEFPDKNFVIIKYAIGGSSMYDWSPNYDKEKAKITGHPEYGNMFEIFMQNIDSILKQENGQFLALLWMQGERDAKVPKAAEEYYKNFSLFIDAIREKTSIKKLPIVYGLVNPDPNKYPALDEVQIAQKRIAKEFDDVYLIETYNLDKWNDKIHYSTTGQLKLGEKFGKKLIEIIQNDMN